MASGVIRNALFKPRGAEIKTPNGWQSHGNLNLDYGQSMGPNTIQDLLARGAITVVVNANVPMDVLSSRVNSELARAY